MTGPRGLPVAAVILLGCGLAVHAFYQGPQRTAHQAWRSMPHDLGIARQGMASILLDLRDKRARKLPADVAAIYDPLSTRYGRFISPSQFGRLYGPSTRELRLVQSYLAQHRLRTAPTRGSPWLLVSGSVRAIDRIFHSDVHRFRLGTRTLLASVHPSRIPRPLAREVLAAGAVSTVTLSRDAIPSSGLTPIAVSRAYDIAPLHQRHIEGAGQTVVFIEVDGVDPTSLATFARRFHLPAFRWTTHGPVLRPGDEATMDLEVVHAIAPEAKLVVYNLPLSEIFANLHHELSQVIAQNPGAIFSESLSLCESQVGKAYGQALQSAYAAADAAGEAVFASSGDTAAFGCITQGDAAPATSEVGTQLPATCPGVTAVGGTTLSVRRDGSWYDEAAWEDPLENAGTGGGPSALFARPSWQHAPGIALQDAKYGTAGHRLIPDVAADADPASGMAIDFPGSAGWQNGGGTSQSTPIWAAIAALIDQYLEQHHHRALGWLNPALYALARTPQAYPPFHQVTVGTNLVFSAGRGYNMATGLGTPDAWFLAQDLALYQSSHGR